MPTIQDALSLAARGWAILPLRGKVPATRHGVKDATTDQAQIHAWWSNGAHWNIGARVPESLVVIDLDPRNGGTLEALEAAHGKPLPDTLTVYSGRGDGGQHLYYLHPGGTLRARALPEGIDVKTQTGYCVMPPSMHPATGQPYRWGDTLAPAPLPGALLRLMQPAPAPRPQTAQPRRQGGGKLLERRAKHLAEHVAVAAEGNRNARLFWAACQAHRDGHPAATFDLLAEAAMFAGLSDSEVRGTLLSAHRTMGKIS